MKIRQFPHFQLLKGQDNMGSGYTVGRIQFTDPSIPGPKTDGGGIIAVEQVELFVRVDC